MSAAPEARGVVPVVAAVIRREDRYLLGCRPEHKRHGGLWEFPGGKRLEGESRREAARRELAEELELEVTSVGTVLHRVHDAGSPYLIEFVEVEAHGEPTPHEHSRLGWFSAADLAGLALAPADARFATWLAGEQAGGGVPGDR